MEYDYLLPPPTTTSPVHQLIWRANTATHAKTLSGWRSWRNKFLTNEEFRPLACKNHPRGFWGYEIDLVSELAKDRWLYWQIRVKLIGTVAETFLRARMRVVSWRAEHNGSRFLGPPYPCSSHRTIHFLTLGWNSGRQICLGRGT